MVKTRYPNWNKISIENLKEALKIAEETFNWVQLIIKE